LIIRLGARSRVFKSAIVAEHNASSMHKAFDLVLRARADQKRRLTTIKEVLKLAYPVRPLKCLKCISENEVKVEKIRGTTPLEGKPTGIFMPRLEHRAMKI